jgi:hypothetical protein
MEQKKLVILNQAVNYLTIGFANAFAEKFDEVVLITGSIHTQGEELSSKVKTHYINKWYERPASKKFLSYIIAMVKMWWLLKTKYRKHEVFFVSVPPMGYLINLALPNKFSMVIWDVYPDAFKILGVKESNFIYKTWAKLNVKSFKKAYKLFTISEKMADLLEIYVNKNKIIIQPIWSIFQENKKHSKENNPFIEKHNLKGKFIVQYSGNIGLSHNVEVMVDLAEMMVEETDIVFQIIGRGPRKPILEKLVQERNLLNCMFLPFQSDDMFPFSLSAADVGMVILDDITSKGSVPSKSYNLMSYGIPSLYIGSVDSQLKVYVDKYNHALLFEKHSLKEAASFLRKLRDDKEYYESISKAAIIASYDFKRKNANHFVKKYLQ